jgi:hypothetical protein
VSGLCQISWLQTDASASQAAEIVKITGLDMSVPILRRGLKVVTAGYPLNVGGRRLERWPIPAPN